MNAFEATCSSRGSDASFERKKKKKQSDSPQKAFCSELFERYPAPARLTEEEEEDGDLEVFVLSVTPLDSRLSPGPHRDRHATLNPTPLPSRLLALSPPESANHRCCPHHRGLLLPGGGGHYLMHTKGGCSELHILDPGGTVGGGSVASVFCHSLHSKTYLVS